MEKNKKIGTIIQNFLDGYPEGALLPKFIPIEDGNLLLEWDMAGFPTMDINTTTMEAYYHRFILISGVDSEIEYVFNFNTGKGYEEFFKMIEKTIKTS